MDIDFKDTTLLVWFLYFEQVHSLGVTTKNLPLQLVLHWTIRNDEFKCITALQHCSKNCRCKWSGLANYENGAPYHKRSTMLTVIFVRSKRITIPC